jgi:flagellar secretion chaperone FliS
MRLVAQFAKSYQSVAVKTASPGQLILMLFDGALRFMASAEAGFQIESFAKRNETVHNNLVRAQDILRELQRSLDMAADGDFSPRMYALYDYMLTQLQTANLKKDPKPIGVVSTLLGQIRDAWAQMLEKSTVQVA